MNQEHEDFIEDIRLEVLNHYNYISPFLNKTSDEQDGRDISKQAEDCILDVVKKRAEDKGYTVYIPEDKARSWYDIVIFRGEVNYYSDKSTDDSFLMPINIKVSEFKTADNLGGKAALYFSLTGKNPDSDKINNWDPYHKKLFQGLTHPNVGLIEKTDFVYLVVNKLEKEVIITPLREISVMISNGSNVPGQVNWSQNRSRCIRSIDESIKYFLNILYDSHKKASTRIASFEESGLKSFME